MKIRIAFLTVLMGSALPFFLDGRPVEFEYGLDLMDGVMVRQSYAGIVIEVGQPALDRARYLLRKTDEKEFRRNKIMSFSYKYRIWPVKPRLYNWTLKRNVLTSREFLPVFNLGRQFSFFTLSEVPRGRQAIRTTSAYFPGWGLAFDFAPFGPGKYELIYGSAEVALQFYKLHDVKVVIDMANDVLAINIDNYKIIYRKKLNHYPDCFGFVNAPLTYGSSPWPESVPGMEVMDFRHHYGISDYRTSPDSAYPRFPVEHYERSARYLKTEAQFWTGLCYYEGNYGARKDFVEAARSFAKAAGNDHVLAQYYLGICYLYGRGVEQSDSKAYDCFRKAARNYHDDSGVMAAMMQCQGKQAFDSARPSQVFISLLAPAILQGNANAFYLNSWRQAARILPEAGIQAGGWRDAVRRKHPKAMMQEPGLPPEEFFRRCETIAADGFVPGIVAAGGCLLRGYGTAADPERGLELLLKGAALGSDHAALQAGKCLLAGIGAPKNAAEAEKLLRPLEYKRQLEATLLGGLFDPTPDPAAALYLRGDKHGAFAAWSRSREPLYQYRAGLCLAAGEGTEPDPREAFVYFSRAAASGLPQANMEVGDCYESGRGVNLKNPRTALEFYRRSAAYPPGALAYARKCLEYRMGKEALPAVKSAADAGIVEAMRLYAELLLNGFAPGIPLDREKGIQAMILAAEAGSVEAMYTLGDCYYRGLGAKADRDRAAEWWTRYHAASDDRDNNMLESLAPYWKPLPNYPEIISVNGMPRYVSEWTDAGEIYKYYSKY